MLCLATVMQLQGYRYLDNYTLPGLLEVLSISVLCKYCECTIVVQQQIQWNMTEIICSVDCILVLGGINQLEELTTKRGIAIVNYLSIFVTILFCCQVKYLNCFSNVLVAREPILLLWTSNKMRQKSYEYICYYKKIFAYCIFLVARHPLSPCILIWLLGSYCSNTIQVFWS